MNKNKKIDTFNNEILHISCISKQNNETNFGNMEFFNIKSISINQFLTQDEKIEEADRIFSPFDTNTKEISRKLKTEDIEMKFIDRNTDKTNENSNFYVSSREKMFNKDSSYSLFDVDKINNESKMNSQMSYDIQMKLENQMRIIEEKNQFTKKEKMNKLLTMFNLRRERNENKDCLIEKVEDEDGSMIRGNIENSISRTQSHFDEIVNSNTRSSLYHINEKEKEKDMIGNSINPYNDLKKNEENEKILNTNNYSTIKKEETSYLNKEEDKKITPNHTQSQSQPVQEQESTVQEQESTIDNLIKYSNNNNQNQDSTINISTQMTNDQIKIYNDILWNNQRIKETNNEWEKGVLIRENRILEKKLDDKFLIQINNNIDIDKYHKKIKELEKYEEEKKRSRLNRIDLQTKSRSKSKSRGNFGGGSSKLVHSQGQNEEKNEINGLNVKGNIKNNEKKGNFNKDKLKEQDLSVQTIQTIQNISNIKKIENNKSKQANIKLKENEYKFNKKSNKKIIKNAIEYVCLAGKNNVDCRLRLFELLDKCSCDNFIILFRDNIGRFDLRGIYTYDSLLDKVEILTTYGNNKKDPPFELVPSMIVNYYKFDNSKKEFKVLSDLKSFSFNIDAVSLSSISIK